MDQVADELGGDLHERNKFYRFCDKMIERGTEPFTNDGRYGEPFADLWRELRAKSGYIPPVDWRGARERSLAREPTCSAHATASPRSNGCGNREKGRAPQTKPVK
jgi:hypothetical protein